jgi:hypothetical protein
MRARPADDDRRDIAAVDASDRVDAAAGDRRADERLQVAALAMPACRLTHGGNSLGRELGHGVGHLAADRIVNQAGAQPRDDASASSVSMSIMSASTTQPYPCAREPRTR